MAAPAILRAASAAAAVLLALCAGAVWSVVALLVGGEASWMALPSAAIVLYALSYPNPSSRTARALFALALYALTIAYAHYLHAASLVTFQLGTSFRDALVAIGPEMAWALATARGDAIDAALMLLVGAALAVLAARGASASSHYKPRNGIV